MNVEDRKSAIVAVAAKLFRERGYVGTTVRDLAKEIDLTSGSIFHHFGSKEEILMDVVESGLSYVEHRMEELLAQGKTPRERIEIMIHTHLSALIEGRPEVLSVFFYERWALTEDALRRLLVMRDRYEDRWSKALAALGGKFKSPAHRRLIRLLLLGSMNSIALWYRPGGEISPEDVARQITTSFIDS